MADRPTALELIRERLRREGRVTFATFMAAALYGPGGYYADRPALGGAGADFFTSPELHSAFGALVGRQVAEVWQAFGRPARFDLVEHGPGSGALCRDLLAWAEHEAPPFAEAVRYVLVETSAPPRATQRATLASAGLLDARVAWADPAADPLVRGGTRGGGSRSDGPVIGCILANELLDALPVHLVTVRAGRLQERYVALDRDGAGLTFVDGEPSTPALAAYFDDLGLLPAEGAQAEVNLAAVAWTERAATTLGRGLLLVLDYGYPAPELYAARRRHGTLLCYRGHTLGSDPLTHVGEQDLTSHVDFTAVARAGERAGLTTLGLADQATFLTNLGLRDYLRRLERAPIRASEHDGNRRALLELIRPDGLGAVKALLQTRGLPDFRPSGVFGQDAGPDSWRREGAPEWLPLLRADQMRLPGPLELEGFGDLEAQWREFWTDQEDPSS